MSEELSAYLFKYTLRNTHFEFVQNCVSIVQKLVFVFKSSLLVKHEERTSKIELLHPANS
jgi:hypothetical protein